MSRDSVTVVTQQSWFGRLGGAIMGVLVGVILFVVAFPLLSWNEGRAIRRTKTLQAGSSLVVSVAPAPVDPANEGRLVHVSGTAVAPGSLSDKLLGVTAPVLKLRRSVEMFQWTEKKSSETRKKLGGGEETVTTYSYRKEWASGLVDSDTFKERAGHANPASLPFETTEFVAREVTLGDFTLPESLKAMMQDYRPFAVPTDEGKPLSQNSPLPIHAVDGRFFLGQDPAQPVVGDVRISYEVVEPGPFSLIARQIGRTFEAYPVEKLGSIELLQPGTVSAAAMFESEHQGNTLLTWLLRVVGFVCMASGLSLFLRPLSVLADVIPFVGNVVGAGLGVISLLVALPLTLGTIAVAWLAYRPLIGVPLLIVALVSVGFGIRALKKRKSPKATMS